MGQRYGRLKTEKRWGSAEGYISSKGKGKSGGARLITNFVIADETVYLLSIYDKSDKENLTDKELDELLGEVPE
jgi:mRNA-degrading endonuclease RelE of RelBE toxin-antitoxin system